MSELDQTGHGIEVDRDKIDKHTTKENIKALEGRLDIYKYNFEKLEYIFCGQAKELVEIKQASVWQRIKWVFTGVKV